MLAYHFTGDTLRDGRPIPAIGETLIHSGEIVWCKSGLYASTKPHKALKYAPGPILHLVSCKCIVSGDENKFVCRSRTIVKSFDATNLLRRFAADQALSVKHLWNMPAIVEYYLTSLDKNIRIAAGDVAWNASRDAVCSSSRDAVSDAARFAACSAASDVARLPAWNAAYSAARYAAWNTASDAAFSANWNVRSKDFDKRVDEVFTNME